MPLKAPDFWTKDESFVSRLLKPLSSLYAFIGERRQKKAAPYKASAPVICVGNLVMGGAGKTPLAVSFAEFFKMNGKRPVFLTRGYGGGLSNVVVDLDKHTATDVGDEALLLARVAPTVVDADRRRGAKLAESIRADVIIMDDGFQNPQLEKDFAVAVFDGKYGIGNGCVFPSGPLRESLESGLKRAHACLFVGADETNLRERIEKIAPDMPFFQTHIEQSLDVIYRLEDKKLLAFAGIGRPEKFFDMLCDYGCRLEARIPFPDHYVYTPADMEKVLRRANELKAFAVTTEKDFVRIPKVYQSRIGVVPAHMIWDTTFEMMEALRRFCKPDERKDADGSGN